MKEKYIPAEVELIQFDTEDVVTASQGTCILDGGYDPNGWT